MVPEVRYWMPDRRRGRPLIERFWSKVDQSGPGGCWLWTDRVLNSGYALLTITENGQRRKPLVHRLAYELLVGPIPVGMTIDHVCHNQSVCPPGPCLHRRCVNPAHLEPVDMETNQKRSPNHRSNRTHCPKGHLWIEPNIKVFANGKRRCRPCWVQWHKDHPRGPRKRTKK